MIITYFRSSSLNGWDQWCKHKYFLDYVLSLESDGNKAADIGTCVHKVMETLASCKKTLQESNEEVLKFDCDCLGELRFTRSMILDKDEVFFQNVIDKSFDYYSNKLNYHAWTHLDKKDVDKLCQKAIKFQNCAFDPRQQDIFEAEKSFDITIDRDWAHYDYELNGEKIEGQLSLKGTIDLIIQEDPKTLHVIDYKTGKHIKDWATEKEKDLDYFQKKDKQLMTYYYALKCLYPDKDIIMTIYYIRLDRAFTVIYDSKVLKDMESYFKSRFNQIKNTSLPKMISPSQTNFKCTRLCHFYKNNWEGTNKNICKFIHDEIKDKGIKYVTETYGTGGHSHYNAPG